MLMTAGQMGLLLVVAPSLLVPSPLPSLLLLLRVRKSRWRRVGQRLHSVQSRALGVLGGDPNTLGVRSQGGVWAMGPSGFPIIYD